jgi:hypothetical protein
VKRQVVLAMVLLVVLVGATRWQAGAAAVVSPLPVLGATSHGATRTSDSVAATTSDPATTTTTYASELGANSTSPSLDGSFSGTASAYGVQVDVSIPNYLIIQSFVDGGGPTAQAQLNSLGTSQGFASFPYPGETAVSLTGLAGILTGLSLPSYPLIVNSSYPTTGSDSINQPAYHLSTQSTPTQATSTAQLGEFSSSGSLGAGAVSSASVTQNPDGSVQSKAETKISFTLGAVGLTGLDSSATVSQAADGTVTKTSSLQIGHLEVAGIPIGITNQGLQIGTTTLGLGGLSGITKLFSTPTTQIQYIPAVVTADSVTSAALEINTTQYVSSIGHDVDVSTLVGSVMASANSALVSSTVPPATTLPTIGLGLSPSSVAPTSTLGGVTPFTSPPVPQPTLPSSSAAAPTTSLGTSVKTSLVGVPLSVTTWALFPMLVLCGAFLLLAIFLGRKRARSPWNS